MFDSRSWSLAAAVVAVTVAAAAPCSAAAADVDPATPTVETVSSGVARGGDARIAGSPGTVRVLKCASSAIASGRVYNVQAHMVPVSRAKTMQMRFHLMIKPPGAAEYEYRNQDLGLGYWLPAQSVSANHNWFVTKNMSSLLPLWTYRGSVDFLWTSGKTTVKSLQAVKAASCVQADVRPNLLIEAVTSAAAGNGLVRYSITVRNSGRGTAPASKIQVTNPPTEANPVPQRWEVNTPQLKVGASAVVRVDAAGCGSGSVLFEVDPGNLLGESTSDDNVISRGCSPSS